MPRILPVMAAFAIALGATVSVRAEETAATAPVVVELFTSQGCNSCPPADALLGELAQQPGVLALSLHVDYWNYIGWTDPFSSQAATERQRAYSRALGRHMVYTPQMVVDGRDEMVGSDRHAVEAAIEAAAEASKVVPRFISGEDGAIRVALPAGNPGKPATVWLAFYDDRHVTPVRRGENAGATLTNYNVVREWRRIGEWTGAPVEFALGPVPQGRDACAVIVQEGDNGPILGAASMLIAPPD